MITRQCAHCGILFPAQDQSQSVCVACRRRQKRQAILEELGELKKSIALLEFDLAKAKKTEFKLIMDLAECS